MREQTFREGLKGRKLEPYNVWEPTSIMVTPLPAVEKGLGAVVIGASAAGLQICCSLWSQGDAQQAACRWDSEWFGTSGPWRTHCTCTVVKTEINCQSLAHMLMQHYISSEKMEVLRHQYGTAHFSGPVFRIWNTVDHKVGNLGSIYYGNITLFNLEYSTK